MTIKFDVVIVGGSSAGLNAALVLTTMLLGWSRDLELCSDDPADLGAAERQLLAQNEVVVREERSAQLEGRDDSLEAIVFADGSRLPRRGVFMRPAQRQCSQLPAMLGCAFDSFGSVQTDEHRQTTVSGLYVAGDAARHKQQLIIAAADGALAAISISNALLMEDVG